MNKESGNNDRRKNKRNSAVKKVNHFPYSVVAQPQQITTSQIEGQRKKKITKN